MNQEPTTNQPKAPKVIHEEKIVVGKVKTAAERQADETPDVTLVTPTFDPNKKTICYVSTSAFWQGEQQYLVGLAAHFSKTHNVALIYGAHEFTGDNVLHEKMEELGVHVVPCPELHSKPVLSQEFGALWSLFKILKTIKPDIVHANDNKMALLAGFAGKLVGAKKIVTTVHHLEDPSHVKSHERGALKSLTKFLLMMSQKIIAIRPSVNALLQSYGLSNKTTLILEGLNSIDTDGVTAKLDALSKSVETETAGLLREQSTTIIGGMAPLEPEQGIFYILSSLGQLKEAGIPFVYIHYGSGDQEKILDLEVTRLGLTNQVVFKPEDRQSEGFVAVFDLVVCANLDNQLPHGLIVGGQGSKAVIATQQGVTADMFGDHIVTVPTKSADALTDAIKKLIDDPAKRKELGRSLNEQIEQTFSADRTNQATAAIYNS